jgi:radical SAM superfamily enzyme YgiQ (UPF0313 family)
LLVYPKYPDTFWGYRYALKFVSRKAGFPPLGLLTVAAMLPQAWKKKLVDCNVRSLKDRDIRSADVVFLSAISVQSASARAIIDRCRSLEKPVVAGGPLFTSHFDEFDDVDHLVLNEAELTLPAFLADLEMGKPGHLYQTDQWADITATPLPRWELIDLDRYGSMNIQYSRGCPYDCEFCDITVLYGRKPRTKTAEQVIEELETLYVRGWRGGVFFVDDNFIGNRTKLKEEILPPIVRWMERRRYPFTLNTEASINLADDEDLMRSMARAGFDTVFVGIESPHEESLIECRKTPNRNRDLLLSVKKIQRAGIQVQGGFIVGFDKDPESIFDMLERFIQESGIVTAMVGLLNAPRGTKLYQRLLKEGRLLRSMSGNNTDFSMNFLPKMNYEALLKGYHRVLDEIYTPKHYYARVRQFLKEYRPTQVRIFHLRLDHIKALVKSALVLGLAGKERKYYWKLFFWSLFTRPRLFPLAITMAIYGFHFRKIISLYIERF